MVLSWRALGLSVGVVGTLAAQSAAAVLHNESVNGDITGDRFNPLAFVLSPGSNTITATSVAGDREYVRLTVPAGMTLSGVVVDAFSGGVNVSFIGVQQGNTMTVDPLAPSAATLLGYAHFGAGNIGSNILPDIAAGPGSIGFTPPLNAANYTFWIQETSTTASTYTLDFVVVPGPGMAGAAVVMLGCVGIRRGRRPL
jgi:hypothetical protein